MAASLQPTSSQTEILDLNDDCLMEVFARIDRKALTTAADVCTRFKQNTMHTALLTIKEIRLEGRRLCSNKLWFGEKSSVYNKYSMLRNFGEFIEKIHVVGYGVEKRIIEYLSLYCVGKSIELRCKDSRITDEIAILMRPLLGRLQKLRFDRCRLDKVLLRNLPLWSAGLQDLEYGASKAVNHHEKQFDRLRQKNLRSVSFWGVSDVKNGHIKEVLQQNPQLKEIELVYCISLDSCILESIARNVPAIEKVVFVMLRKRGAISRDPDHIKYLRQFNKLKSLTLGVRGDDSYVQAVLHEISSVNTGLEHLDLSYFDLRYSANQFIGGISKQQQLKMLRLSHVKNLTAAHLIEICKHAKEISVIILEHIVTMTITNDDLLEIVKNTRKLQEFKGAYRRSSDTFPTNIDGNTFLKLAKLVDQRNEKTNLCICLPCRSFTSTIPANLLTAVNNLKIKIW